MTARERIENYRNGTQQSGGLTARERIENYRQENGLSAEPAAAETVQTAAEPVQASSAAAKAQPLHSAINAAAPGSFGGRLESSAARLRQELQPTAQRRGREQIQAELDSNAKEMQAVADGIKAMEGTLRRTQGSYGRVRDAYTADRLLQQQTEQQATLDESRRQLDELTAKRAQLERELQDAKYNEWLGLMQQPDFAEKSRYKSTENGQERKFSPVTGTYTGTGFDDIYYDYINGNQTAQDMTLLADTAQGTSHEGWRGLPENVVSLFNYIYATQGRDKAYAFLDEAAQRAYTGLEAAALSFASGTGALSLGAALGSIGGGESAKRTADVYKQLTRETQESAAQHPGLARAGSITGNIALMYGIGAGAGTIAAKAGLPYIAGRTAVGALSFGGANAIQNAGAVSTGQMSIEDYLEGVGIGLAAGGIGSAAGAFASSGVAALLEKYGLMTSFGEFIRQTAGGVTESSVNTATEYALRGEAPTKEELAQTLITTFAFSIITSAANTLKTTAAQKANMEEAARVLNEGYARLMNEANGMTPEGVAQQAQRILEQIDSTRNTLKGTYIAGQQEAVNKIYAGLDILEDVMKGYLNGYAGSSYAPGGVTGGSGGYGMTVLPAQNGAGGAQGASGPQTGTNIAAAAGAAQRSSGGTQNGSNIAPATQAPAAAVSPGQQNAAPGAGAASAGGIQANNSANAGAGNLLRESTNVNDNPAQHTEAEQRVIEEYKNAVDPGLVEFVKESVANKGANSGRYYLNPVSERAAADIKALTGVEVTGYKTAIEQRMAEQIYAEHGPEGTADRSMSDLSDIGRMQYVLNNYDSISHGGSTSSYVTNKPNGRHGQAQSVRYEKAVNGTYYVIEAVPDAKARTAYIVSAYMSKEKKGAPNLQTVDESTSTRTAKPENAVNGAPSVPTIPQPSPAVNTLENTRDGENGWGTRYNSAAEALEAGMQELAPSLWREYSGAEYTPQRDAIVAAVMRVGQDVGRGTVSPAKALQYLERAYKGGGIEAIERIASTPGEKYAPRAGETVTLPTAEQELAERNGGNLNGQKRTETDTGGQKRTGDGNALPDRSAGRDAGERAGGKADGMEARRGGRADAGRKAIERQNRGRRLPLERVSSRELGLKQGTENPNLKLLPEDAWDDGLRQTAERLEQETGRSVTYVLGGMEIEDADGETHTVRGVITQEQIIIQADCMSATAEQIGEHELFHYYADENPGLISSVREEITEKYGREEFDEIVGKYIERLRGIIDVSDSPFADAQDAVLEDIENEIFADAYAGINAFGAHAERYQGEVRAVTEQRGVTSRQTREATERRTGPPERRSVEAGYADMIGEWASDGRPEGETFTLGTTGDALQGLGAMEQDIYMRSEKINAILEKHPEMTIAQIKRIPEILDDPVLILKSRGVGSKNNTRMVLFGTVRAENGLPVMSVLDLKPTEGGLAIDDMQKVNSAYTKDGGAQFVSRSDVMYADEKRTIPLLRSLGLTVASRGLLRHGSLGSITYSGSGVKLEGVPFADAVDAGNAKQLPVKQRFSVSDEEGGEKKKERAVIAQQELHRTLNTMFSIPAGTKAEMNAIVDGFAAKAMRDGSLTQDDMTALFDRLYNSGVMEVAADEYRQAARSAVEKKRIYVPEDVKHEFGDDWNGFRRQAFAAGVYLTNSEGDYGIDVLNQELAASLPEIFAPDETDMRLILERVVQAAEEGKAQKMSLAEYTAMLAEQEYVSESEVLDTLERQLDWAMRTFAEKARIEVTLRERADSKRASERIRKARERELERAAKERARRREIIVQQRKQKELHELQQKTLKQLQWLSKNRYKAPEELQRAFDDVLSDIDIYAAGAADEMRISKKYSMTWRDLADVYKEAKEKDANFFPSKELEQIVARLDNRKIADMDIDALTDLYKAAVGLRTELYNRNNVIKDELHRTFAEVYTDSVAEIRSAKQDNGKAKLFNTAQLSPMNMLQRAAGGSPESTFYSMARQLEKGERDVRAYIVKANRMLEDFLNEHREWAERADGQGKNAVWYELEVPELLELRMGDKPIFGNTFKVYMTPSQKVQLYLESKSYENLRHMAGGRTFPDKKTYSEGKRKEAFEKGRTIKLAPETVRKIVSSLTPEEMELAGVLERYYNDFAKGEINRVSNALYGYDKAVSKNYAPIYTNKSYVQSTPGVYNATAEGVGNLKAREYAKNASLNIGAFDAFEKHMEQTARFVGMAIPARNWTTLMNWQGNGTSMKDAINHKWTGGASYIEDLLAELQGNGGVQRDEISTFADKVFGNYISAVFGANPSIVLKQLGSIPLAGVWLGYKNMPSPAQLQRIDRGLIAKYTQELAWRTLGYAIPETKFLKEHPNWTQTNRFTRFTFGGGAITAMDGWAASVLWPWAENKVRREHPELAAGTQEDIDSGASPFYKRVAEEFDEAVARSQSTSDIMHQGTLRRSKNPISKAVTMFKSDSSQSYNALRQLLMEAEYYKKNGDSKSYRKAVTGLATALLAILGGNLWAELVEFLMNLWKYKGKRYRDDNGELTADSMAGEMAIGLVGDIAGMSAGGEELAEWLANGIANGSWGLERIEVFGLEQINDFAEAVIKQGNSGLKALKGAADVVKNGGDPIEYLHRHAGDIAGGIKELAKLIATYVPALPVNNLEAYMLGTVRWVSPELAAAYEDLFKTATKDRLKGLTGGALEERVGSIFDVRSINASEGAAREAARLYEAGFTMAVPSDTPGSLSVGGEERKLEAYQKQVYDQVWAGGVGEALNELVQLDAYENAGDAEREKMFKAVYDYAADKAKAVVFEDYTPQKTTEGADAVIAAGGTAAQWGAWIGMAAGLEDSAQKYKLLKSLDYSDKVKLAIAGSIMGTEMETDGGAPSQYAKMLEAVGLGLDMNSYIELREAKAVDKFLDAANAGASIETAKNAALKLSALEPEEGKKSVSDVQKWRAAVDAGGTTEEQMNALKAVMREEQYTKLEIALSYGIEPESYVHLKELLPQYDKDGSGGISNEELEKAIDTMGGGLLPGVGQLTREQQAVLWQLFSGSKSAKNNPYSRTVGQKILDAREKGEEKDLSALMG